MKKMIFTALFLTMAISTAHAATDAHCVMLPAGTTGENVSFNTINGEHGEKELRSVEKAEDKDVKFLLREGHGITTLEAYKDGKLVASALPQKDSTMDLLVLNSKGQEVESFCVADPKK